MMARYGPANTGGLLVFWSVTNGWYRSVGEKNNFYQNFPAMFVSLARILICIRACYFYKEVMPTIIRGQGECVIVQ